MTSCSEPNRNRCSTSSGFASSSAQYRSRKSAHRSATSANTSRSPWLGAASFIHRSNRAPCSSFSLRGLSQSTRIRIPSSDLGSSSMFFVQNKIDPRHRLFATPDDVVDSWAKNNVSQQANNRLAIISESSFGKLVSVLIYRRYEITFYWIEAIGSAKAHLLRLR